jgi:hypothetical protein
VDGARSGLRPAFSAVGFALAACSGGSAEPGSPLGGARPALPYATEVTELSLGEGAGFGEDRLPEVVLGPPAGRGLLSGSLDVLSLGKGGSIALGFGELAIVDGQGPDFVVFENAFYPGGDPASVYAEPGSVSVSEDGVTFVTFDCQAQGDGEGRYPGCAGVTPTLEFDAEALVPLDPELTGGDAFDLAALGLTRVTRVRVTDASYAGSPPSAGFDLDAIGIIHAERLVAP